MKTDYENSTPEEIYNYALQVYEVLKDKLEAVWTSGNGTTIHRANEIRHKIENCIYTYAKNPGNRYIAILMSEYVWTLENFLEGLAKQSY